MSKASNNERHFELRKRAVPRSPASYRRDWLFKEVFPFSIAESEKFAREYVREKLDRHYGHRRPGAD